MCLKAENFRKINFQALTEKTRVPQGHSLSNTDLLYQAKPMVQILKFA